MAHHPRTDRRGPRVALDRREPRSRQLPRRVQPRPERLRRRRDRRRLRQLRGGCQPRPAQLQHRCGEPRPPRQRPRAHRPTARSGDVWRRLRPDALRGGGARVARLLHRRDRAHAGTERRPLRALAHRQRLVHYDERDALLRVPDGDREHWIARRVRERRQHAVCARLPRLRWDSRHLALHDRACSRRRSLACCGS